VPKPVAVQDIDLLCIATAASTKPRLTMVQIVPRRPNLDAPANATEHKAIRVKPWVDFPPPYPMSCVQWRIDSAGMANAVGDARPISKAV
jgi:hypothetical protein